ncbi:hypothetical protein [Candidatus Reidiella endopervernicosa]|uniref:Uncharacterized protein n=1 Tax=Candidatus Reidiella endopervernicosa TaxID=2738883 RepID=A0A6N0HYG2_9GAMM|nr:hypothetical protein [Candidatus Reidiella endopervernicosa]QKQ27403.1 hypothetical protein HUE57_14770 [Candidatus Reidiella endopervernicosa]
MMIKQQDKDLYVELAEMTENTGSFAQYHFNPLGTSAQPKSKRNGNENSSPKQQQNNGEALDWKLI